MPQFDQLSFTNQVFWFFFFFLSFYFLISYFFLPKLSENIKFRKKKINIDNTLKQNFLIDKTLKQFKLLTLYTSFYNFSEKLFQKILNKNTGLIENQHQENFQVKKINQPLIFLINQHYFFPKKF